ncbi:MAG: hypothetical protein QOD83_1004, partial [Solirubrobacteraceae bacterium]|nr:hypothetical protein [Solirubrobacteraceae bacterium]
SPRRLCRSITSTKIYLGQLMAERLEATEAGRGENVLYMSELEDDLAAARDAYVGLAASSFGTDNLT